MRCLLDLVDKGLQIWCKPHSDTAQKLHLRDTICGIGDRYAESHFCNLWYALLAIGIRLAILFRRSIGKWLLME
jgi:hypothetical protein